MVRRGDGAARGWDVKLTKRPEELLYFICKRGWLLHRREMTALFHLRPSLNICVGLFCNRAGWHDYFLRESSIPSWDRDRLIWRNRPTGVQAPIIWPERRADRSGEPVKSNIR